MRGALNRVVEQGQQLGSERLYLLFGLSAGFGCVWGKLAAEPGDLGRKLVVLSREDRHLLLGNPRTGLASFRSCSRSCARSRQRRVAALSAVSLIVARQRP